MQSIQVSALRLRVRRDFHRLPYPLLAIALRELDDMLLERVAYDPAGAYGEQREFDAEQERALAEEAVTQRHRKRGRRGRTGLRQTVSS